MVSMAKHAGSQTKRAGMTSTKCVFSLLRMKVAMKEIWKQEPQKAEVTCIEAQR